MLKMRRTLGICALIFVLVAWVGLVAPSCQIDNRSISATDQTKNNKSPNYKCPSFGTLFVRKVFDVAHSRDKEVTALSTLAIALFTIILAVASGLQYLVLSKSIALARNEFISTHRPRIRLKHVWLEDEREWRLERPLEVNLDFVNIGGTIAHITWINYDTVLLRSALRLPQRPPYDETPFGPHMRISRFRTPIDLRSGITFTRTVSDGRTFTQAEIRDVLWGDQTLYLIGTIEYWDDPVLGLRQTGFCRRLSYNRYPADPDDWGRFDVVEDPDYEFED
jgi:hypothetical protein